MFCALDKLMIFASRGIWGKKQPLVGPTHLHIYVFVKLDTFPQGLSKHKKKHETTIYKCLVGWFRRKDLKFQSNNERASQIRISYKFCSHSRHELPTLPLRIHYTIYNNCLDCLGLAPDFFHEKVHFKRGSHCLHPKKPKQKTKHLWPHLHLAILVWLARNLNGEHRAKQPAQAKYLAGWTWTDLVSCLQNNHVSEIGSFSIKVPGKTKINKMCSTTKPLKTQIKHSQMFNVWPISLHL